ncbi:TPA: hypothetical protein ACHYXZ_005014 [Escherichia coli]|uniref:hypothetical protein n=1 Tax=Escherichia coli TaxID=562 RepID=UPI000B153267|nr:hypothetical protein [Escherichia coli]EFG2179267.1 hypothetical protein [Escherichia coli]EIO6568428.1 hypothetical protein [Escherichia coli]HAX3219814.1 hypothetical protein [Escherichia coli]HAX3354260.1 hypothetical protein [Escherichia coli]
MPQASFLSLSPIFVVVDYLKERFHWPGVTREETALSLHALSDKAVNNELIPRDNAGFPVFRYSGIPVFRYSGIPGDGICSENKNVAIWKQDSRKIIMMFFSANNEDI